MKRTAILTRMGILMALGVATSYASAIPLFGARLFPAQHAINVVAGVVLGPWYAVLTAAGISMIRVLLGTGTPLAFPGSMIGALLAGLAYQATRSRLAAMAGEAVGTGFIGAVAAYPVAVLLMGSARAAAGGMAYFIVPFALSSVSGAILGGIALRVLGPLVGPAGETPA